MWALTLRDRIAEIPPDVWDAVGHDPLSRHAVLSALEQAEIPGLRTRYAVFRTHRGGLLACVPYASIPIDGLRLTHGPFRRAIQVVRRMAPRFMHTRLCICGTALSVGNPPIRMAAGVSPEPILRAAAGLLNEIADDLSAAWRAFKEFPRAQLGGATALSRRGWILTPSEPNFVLPILWRSFDDYLASLRSPYRYKLCKSARRAFADGIQVEVGPLRGCYDSELHRLYEAVVDRAAIQLERLTPKFFQRLGEALPGQTRLIRFVQRGRVLGWVALMADGDRIHDLFHGIDYVANRHSDLYFNQLAETVRVAIRVGADHLILGQSTGIAKTRFGARPQPLWTLLRHRSASVNQGLRRSALLLFPSQTVPQRRVFRQMPVIGEETT